MKIIHIVIGKVVLSIVRHRHEKIASANRNIGKVNMPYLMRKCDILSGKYSRF